jgi:hypothetical protein
MRGRKLVEVFANKILMVKPTRIASNPETVDTNVFQGKSPVDAKKALEEFDQAVNQLRESGIEVVVSEPESDSPDAVFPNNWLSTHPGSRAILYPMATLSRRAEVNLKLVSQLGYEILYDFSQDSMPLEGTGSLVFDYANKIAFACQSSRTHPDQVEKVCKLLGFSPVMFSASFLGAPIYHTNVLMAIGEKHTVCCLEACDTPELLRSQIKQSIIEISSEQMACFAGNMLQLQKKSGELVWVLSQNAFDSLDSIQVKLLSESADLIVCNVSSIENAGGGSVRCMICELF